MRAFLLLSSLAAVGCGSVVNDGAGGNDGGVIDASLDSSVGPSCSGNVPASDLKACYVRALCRQARECESASFAASDDCEALLFDYFRFLGVDLERSFDQVVAQIGAGVVSYSGTALSECLFSGESCTVESEACDRIFTGLKVGGASCTTSTECGAGGRCINQQGTNPQCLNGMCLAAAKVGEPCGGTPCDEGLHCPVTGPNVGICVSGDLGTECTNDSDCDSSLYCDRDGTDRCTARNEEGQVCMREGNCLAPLSCIEQTCQRPDSDGDRCLTSCLGPFFCDQDLALPVCKRSPTLGQSCSSLSPCDGVSLSCQNDTCVKLALEGAACDALTLCDLGLFCQENVCAQPLDDGAQCSRNNNCDSYVCQGAGEQQTCVERDLCY